MDYDELTIDATLRDFRDRARDAHWSEERIASIIDDALDDSNDLVEVITNALCTIDDELEGFEQDF